MLRRLAIATALMVAAGCSSTGPSDLLAQADVCQGDHEEFPPDTVACTTDIGRVVAQTTDTLDLQVAMHLDAGELPIVVGDGWLMSGTDGTALLQAADRLDGELLRDECDGQRWLGIAETAC